MLSPGDIALMHSTVVQLANATLTTIEAPGALAGNGDPGTPVAVWTGAARGFLEHIDKSTLSETVEADQATYTLIVFDEAGATVSALAAGPDWSASTVIVSDERLPTAVVRRFTVVGMTHEADGTLDHALLSLNAPRAVT